MRKRELIAKHLQKIGYEGIDSCPSISLYEYGLLCKETVNERGVPELRCVYAYGSVFDHGHIEIPEIFDFPNEDWFDKEGFFSFIGQTYRDWKYNSSPVMQLYDLISYYGVDNILGSTYSPLRLSATLKWEK